MGSSDVKHSEYVPQNPSKQIFVNLVNDPDLIAIDVQSALQSKGFQVDLSTGETQKSQLILSGNKVTSYSNVSESQAPFELSISYWRGGYPYRINWRALLRDRTTNQLIGTYKYNFNAAYQSLGWSNEKLLNDMIEELVIPAFDK
jgi:hypothetical protein